MSNPDTAVSPWEVVLERASLDPRRAVFDAFELLTNTIVGVAKSSPQAASRLGFWLFGDQVVNALVATNLAHPALPDAYRRLQHLRDGLQSNSSLVPSPVDARRFVELASKTANSVLGYSGTLAP